MTEESLDGSASKRDAGRRHGLPQALRSIAHRLAKTGAIPLAPPWDSRGTDSSPVTRPAVGGRLARFVQVTQLARLQVWLGAGECPRSIGAGERVGRQAALAGALVDDPPAEELGRGRHFLVGA